MTDSNDNLLWFDSSVGTNTLLSAKQGEAWARERIYNVYRGRIQFWIQQQGVRGADVDDVHQNVITSILRSLTRFKRQNSSHSLAAWIRHITKCRTQDYYRSLKSNRVTYAGDQIDHFSQPVLPDDSRHPELWSAKVRDAMAIVEAEFEVHNWQAFCRTVFDEATPAEVAKELGISVNVVYLAKSRILKRLRDLLR